MAALAAIRPNGNSQGTTTLLHLVGGSRGPVTNPRTRDSVSVAGPSAPPLVEVSAARGRRAEHLARELSWLADAPRVPVLNGAERLEMLAQLSLLEAQIKSTPRASIDAHTGVVPERTTKLVL